MWRVSLVRSGRLNIRPPSILMHYLSLGDRRRRELIRIRQMYIPELIIRLHSLLVSSRNIVPSKGGTTTNYLKLALELTNIVADSRYKIYEDFVNEDGRRLGDYLAAVRQAVLKGLDGGGSDPFRSIVM